MPSPLIRCFDPSEPWIALCVKQHLHSDNERHHSVIVIQVARAILVHLLVMEPTSARWVGLEASQFLRSLSAMNDESGRRDVSLEFLKSRGFGLG